MSSKKSSDTPPIILAILDGWGLAPASKGNAVSLAKTPVMAEISKKYPYITLQAHGRVVGLPASQAGNSEAGHMNLGAGRIVEQDAVEISQAISSGVFFKNPALFGALNHVKKNNSRLQVMGLLSEEQSAHMNPDHLLGLITLFRKKRVKAVFFHFFTDGRDSPKFIAGKLMDKWQNLFKANEQIASIMGRYWAMDRKKNWQNIEKAYNALVLGEGYYFPNAREAVIHAYNREESDEFISPSLMANEGERCSHDGNGACNPKALIGDNDAVIFFNLRSDRSREITKCFVQKNFNKMNPGSFKRKKVLNNLYFVAMTDFGPDLDSVLTAFPSRDLLGTLPMAMKDFRQLYIAESEKYAHVTYFFNGGYKDPVGGEARIMVKSPEVKSYDEKPEMSIYQVTKVIIDNLKNKVYDFITVNFANPDMVGHTGNLKAGIAACEAVDKGVGELYKFITQRGGTLIVTADHGNVEEMIDLETGEIDTEHSTNPVPFILVNDKLKQEKLKSGGVLADVAPTILELAGVERPREMSRRGLL